MGPSALEQTETEMEGMSTNPDLEDACKRFLAITEKIKDKKEERDLVASRIMDALRVEGRTSLRFMGWEFEIDAPAAKIKCHPVKAKKKEIIRD